MSTQVSYPWRATLRTAVAGVVGLVSILPAVIADLGWSGTAYGAQIAAVAAAVTRVLALPAVDGWVRRFAPWLAPTPPLPPPEPEPVSTYKPTHGYGE